MKQFTVWVDYPRRQIWMQKNQRFGTPFEYDMSGLLLESADDTYRRAVVRNVLPGSPGAEAGVRVDDELMAISGEQVAGLRLDDVRARLRVPGQTLRLDLRRGEQSISVEITTRRMI